VSHVFAVITTAPFRAEIYDGFRTLYDASSYIQAAVTFAVHPPCHKIYLAIGYLKASYSPGVYAAAAVEIGRLAHGREFGSVGVPAYDAHTVQLAPFFKIFF
jgi:hypothetical protein